MKSQYLYLVVDLLCFLLPLAFSFHPKADFSTKWKYVWPSILISALVFIAWDIAFTKAGVWGFNEAYVMGYYILGLPVEEILFFICIPYACLFTYYTLKALVARDYFYPHHEVISTVIIILTLIFGIYFMKKAYTSATFLLTGFYLAWHMLKLRPNYMGRFYFAYALLLIPFLLINSILTGSITEEPVVWYNDDENIGFRIGTIPFEDLLYGMMVVLIPVTLSERFATIRPKKRKP